MYLYLRRGVSAARTMPAAAADARKERREKGVIRKSPSRLAPKPGAPATGRPRPRASAWGLGQPNSVVSGLPSATLNGLPSESGTSVDGSMPKRQKMVAARSPGVTGSDAG